jgi:hypothetical protein
MGIFFASMDVSMPYTVPGMQVAGQPSWEERQKMTTRETFRYELCRWSLASYPRLLNVLSCAVTWAEQWGHGHGHTESRLPSLVFCSRAQSAPWNRSVEWGGMLGDPSHVGLEKESSWMRSTTHVWGLHICPVTLSLGIVSSQA